MVTQMGSSHINTAKATAVLRSLRLSLVSRCETGSCNSIDLDAFSLRNSSRLIVRLQGPFFGCMNVQIRTDELCHACLNVSVLQDKRYLTGRQSFKSPAKAADIRQFRIGEAAPLQLA